MSKPQGRMHTPEEWKCIFMSACGWEVAFLPGLDGRFLPYGYRSSKLTKKQMGMLMDFIEAWGAENGDNMADMKAKGRGRSGTKPGEDSGHNKVTEAEVIEIRRRCRAGERQYDVAAVFGIAQGTVSDIICKRTWRHIP
jgi:hypothetical protein